GEAHPELLHVGLERRVGVQPHLGHDLPVVLAAELDLLRLGHQRELPLPRHRVDGARSHARREDERRNCTVEPTSLLHRSDLLPAMCPIRARSPAPACTAAPPRPQTRAPSPATSSRCCESSRSEEHTSELQSRENLVCRLLLEKKKHEE